LARKSIGGEVVRTEGALRWGAVGAIGLVEHRLASSSKPNASDKFDPSSTCPGESRAVMVVVVMMMVGAAVGVAMGGVVERAICCEARGEPPPGVVLELLLVRRPRHWIGS
jgi:hypothetical protein